MAFAHVLAIVCLLTVINVKPIKTSNSTKCHSLCVCLDSAIVDCSNRSLTTVPDDLPRNASVLLLRNNKIESLSPDMFLYLRHLTKVDLSGNKIKCDCSLSWAKNASYSLQLVAASCHSPPWLVGRTLANLTVQDMCRTCKMNASTLGALRVQPQRDDYEENDIVMISCPQDYIINGPTSLLCMADGTWNSTMSSYCQAIPPTTPVATSTAQTTVLTTTAPPPTTRNTTAKATTQEHVKTTEVPTTPHKLQTTTTERLTTPTKGQTTVKVSVPVTTRRTNGASVPVRTRERNMTTVSPPTDQNNITDPNNLTSLINMSSRRELNAESLKNLVEMLENSVYGRNYSDSTTTKNFLLISSNLMRKENRKTWSSVNENFPGVERLLKAVNGAMRLQATHMLKSNTNSSQHFSVSYSNIEAEIQVGVGEKMAENRIQFPSKRSLEGDYVQFFESTFKTAGKSKVAVVGMKSAQLGDLLPHRSFIDHFDSFQIGSGVLSASVFSLRVNISSPVRIRFKNKVYLGKDEEHSKCVFWKHGRKVKKTTKNGWSDEGCEVLSRNRSTTICHCDHMTDFAVLTQSIEEIAEPTIIMYIAGVCLLIGAVIAFIRNLVVWLQTRRERLSLLMHECLAFILTAVVFLLGLFLDYHQAMCVIFAALLHWFVLAVFCWILAEFLQLYLCVNFGWNRSSSRLKYFAILGWVAPLVFVAITLAVTRQNDYGSTQWCWYSDSQVLLFAYVCPSILCILVSFVVILKIVAFKSDVTDDSEKKDLSVILALSGFQIPLVLCTFTTAALSADRPEEKVFQYLFATFCIVLSIYICVYHCWLDREITKLSARKNVQRDRPKRDYYSTKETVMYSEDTSEGKNFSLIFPSRKSPTKKPNKTEKRSAAKRSDSSSPFDYDATVPMYPSINDSSLKSFKSQVSTQQHTLDTPPNTLTAITISRPNSQCIELTSLSDLDRRPDGAEQTDAGEHSEFYGARHSNPLDKERQRTSGCSSDLTNATTFGKERVVQDPCHPSDAPNNNSEDKNRISGASSTGMSRTSRSSVSGASLSAAVEENEADADGALEDQPFIRHGSDLGPEVRSAPPAKIPKRRKRGSRRRLDDEYNDEDNNAEVKINSRQSSSSLPSADNSVKLKQYTSF